MDRKERVSEESTNERSLVKILASQRVLVRVEEQECVFDAGQTAETGGDIYRSAVAIVSRLHTRTQCELVPHNN